MACGRYLIVYSGEMVYNSRLGSVRSQVGCFTIKSSPGRLLLACHNCSCKQLTMRAHLPGLKETPQRKSPKLQPPQIIAQNNKKSLQIVVKNYKARFLKGGLFCPLGQFSIWYTYTLKCPCGQKNSICLMWRVMKKCKGEKVRGLH